MMSMILNLYNYYYTMWMVFLSLMVRFGFNYTFNNRGLVLDQLLSVDSLTSKFSE